jgi:hypothetical protein
MGRVMLPLVTMRLALPFDDATIFDSFFKTSQEVFDFMRIS